MLHTTRGVVLRAIRHGDSTFVLRAFTQELGVRSFLVRVGGRGGISQASLLGLNRVEIVAKETSERDLLSAQELRVYKPYERVHKEPVRGTLLLFVQEVLYRVLRGESGDSDLFSFVEQALEAMDTMPDVRNYPLVFLVRLSGELGFMPSPPLNGEEYFDLHGGEFLSVGHTMGPPLSTHLAALLSTDFGDRHQPNIAASHRRELLDRLLLYFRLHVDGLGELHSPLVLHQVLG